MRVVKRSKESIKKDRRVGCKEFVFDGRVIKEDEKVIIGVAKQDISAMDRIK